MAPEANAFCLESYTLANEAFREVVWTTSQLQLVVMSVDDEIDNEVHPTNDQFIRVEQGKAEVVVNNGETAWMLSDGDAVMIPAGTYHRVINMSPPDDDGQRPALKLYTIYSPPHHPPHTLHPTKQHDHDDHAGR